MTTAPRNPQVKKIYGFLAGIATKSPLRRLQITLIVFSFLKYIVFTTEYGNARVYRLAIANRKGARGQAV
jgi:hypothetical protein